MMNESNIKNIISDPIINNISNEKDVLKFEISNVNVSIVNGLRRIMLSEIPTVVVKTFPHKDNKCDITVNTTRLNNEIIKQRLSCIPIHINNMNKDSIIPFEQYIIKVDKQNKSEYLEHVTTEDFQILDTVSNKLLSVSERGKIFPKNSITKHYIDLCRLRPKLSNNLKGEHLQFTAIMQSANASENGMFNVVSNACYGCTMDAEKAESAWKILENTYKSDKQMTEAEISAEKANWYLLQAFRHFKPNSYDFTVESVGVYTNKQIVYIACNVMIHKLLYFKEIISDETKLYIIKSVNTMTNCYDIILENEDYTIGKVLEYMLYTLHYEGDETLSFIGFNKKHPHDSFSTIRIAFKKELSDLGELRDIIVNCVLQSSQLYSNIGQVFKD